jgi:hypothetical protein
MQGSMSRISSGAPAAFERVNYMRMISSYTARTGKNNPQKKE